ncbi:MAG: BrnA antitoxin family protein [Candidatus Acidiferrales bacterium]
MSKKSIKSDLARIDQMKDAEINYADIPPLDKSSLKRATTAWPPVKKQLTIRLDADVLAWLKAQGKGYQTRINRILRVAMESQPPARFGEIPSRRLPMRETSKPRAASGGSRARTR